LLQFLEGGNLRHVNYVVQTYVLGSDLNTGEVVDGEIAERMRESITGETDGEKCRDEEQWDEATAPG